MFNRRLRSPHPAAVVAAGVLLGFSVVAFAGSEPVRGICLLALALVGITFSAWQYDGRRGSPRHGERHRVANLRYLMGGTAVLGLAFGAIAIAMFVASKSVGGIAVSAALSMGLFGCAFFFESLRHTASDTRCRLEGEYVLTQGVGRGGQGFFGGQVVVATDKRIAAVPARRLSRHSRTSTSIPYGEVSNFYERIDSLIVEGGAGRITLTHCPPSQVEALAAKLRQHTSS